MVDIVYNSLSILLKALHEQMKADFVPRIFKLCVSFVTSLLKDSSLIVKKIYNILLHKRYEYVFSIDLK